MTEEERDLKAGAVVGRLDNSMVNPLFLTGRDGSGAAAAAAASTDDFTANVMEL